MRIILLLAALALTGCVTHEITVTNTSTKDATLSQAVPGGEHSITIHPGASISFSAPTPLLIEGLRVDCH